MRRYWYRRILIMILIFTIAVGGSYYFIEAKENSIKQEVSVSTSDKTMVIPGGMPVGIYLETEGVMVLGTDSIEDKEGIDYEPSEHLVKSGDYIMKLNKKEIQNKNELIEAIESLEQEEVVLTIKRKGETIHVKTKAVEYKRGEYKEEKYK